MHNSYLEHGGGDGRVPFVKQARHQRDIECEESSQGDFFFPLLLPVSHHLSSYHYIICEESSCFLDIY